MWLESMLDNERQVLGPEKGKNHCGGFANSNERLLWQQLSLAMVPKGSLVVVFTGIHLGEVSILEWAAWELKGVVQLTSIPFDICPSRSIAHAFLDDGRGLVGGDFGNHR